MSAAAVTTVVITDMLATGGRLSGLALYPLPDLRFKLRIAEDDQVFVGEFRHLVFDLAALRIVRQSFPIRRRALIRHHAALLGEYR